MRIIAIANHKGGVGKTTTVVNLSAGLARAGYKVLCCDMDPQTSLTSALGVGDCAGVSISEVMAGKVGISAIVKVIPIDKTFNMHLAPSNISLANIELVLAARSGREVVLKSELAKIRNNYDVCIVDTQPSLSLLTINALVACQGVIAPTLPQAADLRGLQLFIQSLEVLKGLNPEARLLGVLICMYDSRFTHHQQAKEILEQSGLPLFKAIIGKSVRAAESAGLGIPLILHDPSGPRTKEYNEFINEVEQWVKSKR